MKSYLNDKVETWVEENLLVETHLISNRHIKQTKNLSNWIDFFIINNYLRLNNITLKLFAKHQNLNK
jgi:hypothetical protein